MTLYTVSHAILEAGGQILLCGNQPFGYVFQAQVSGRICCIVMPSGKQPARYPFEQNALTHVVNTHLELDLWLANLIRTPVDQEEALTSPNDDRHRIRANESLL